MCSHLFGGSSGGVLGGVGDVIGGLAGAYFGGPVGAALGAEAGGTIGGVAGGEKLGQAAGNALIGAGVAGAGTFGAEALGSTLPGSGGTDLFGVSGTPAAPSPVSAAGNSFPGVADGSQVFVGDAASGAAPSTDTGWVDTTTGQPVPAGTPGAQPVAGAQGAGTGSVWQDSPGSAPATSTDPMAQGGASKTAGSGVLSNIASTLGIPQSSILPAGVAGIGLAKDLLTPSTLKGESQLSGIAAQQAQQSQVMQNYLATGTLPPGVQTAIDQATAGAQAQIRAKYAQMGLSGSSMEQQELSNAKLQAVSSGAQVAINLYSQGLKDADISQEIYKTLLTTDQNQQQQTGQAISSLAAALSGGVQPRQQQPAQVV